MPDVILPRYCLRLPRTAENIRCPDGQQHIPYMPIDGANWLPVKVFPYFTTDIITAGPLYHPGQ